MPEQAPPQYSPDGRWWWDGTKWIPAGGAPPSAHHSSPQPGAPLPSRKPGFWSEWPLWVTVIVGLLLWPVTGFVFIFRRGWSGRVKTGAAAGWTVVILAVAIGSAAASSTPSGNTSSAGGSGLSSPSPSPSPSAVVASPSPPLQTVAANSCIPNPMQHVYNPDRLRILNPCVTVAGTVDVIRTEADGDYHVLIHLDPGQLCAGQDCLNSVNVSQQRGDLVVEPVCEHSITQSDAVSACTGYHNALAVPPVGSRTTVTGPWVLDQDHGWNEIHPAEMFGSQAMSADSAAPSAPAPATFSVTITASRYGYVAAKTSPGATCSAQAQLPSGRMSTASGLQVQQTAGSDGSVSWSYRTSGSTKPGTGTHTVTCTLNGVTKSASATFTVT